MKKTPAIEVVLFAPLGDLACAIGKIKAGRRRVLTFPEAVSPERMSMFSVFCQPMRYIDGKEFPAFTTTTEFPTRPAGSHQLYPADEQDGYYITSYRGGGPQWNEGATGWKAFDVKPPSGRKIVMQAGSQHPVEKHMVIFVAGGEVNVRRELTVQKITAPAIVDARLGGVAIEATTDAVICEVWS